MHHVGYCHGDTPGDGSYTADDLILRAGQWLSLHEHLRGGGGGGGGGGVAEIRSLCVGSSSHTKLGAEGTE